MEVKEDKYEFIAVVLGTTLCELNYEKHQIEVRGNPSSFLPFSHMQSESGHKTFLFNPQHESFLPIHEGFIEEANKIYIPEDIIAGKSIGSAYFDSVNDESRSNGYGITMLGELFNHRIVGNPVTIDLDANQFYLDTPNNVLKSLDQTISLDLNLCNTEISDNKKFLSAYYFKEGYLLTNEPDTPVKGREAVMVRFPELKVMDPVGASIMDGYPPHHYLSVYPMQGHWTAEAYTIKEARSLKILESRAAMDIIQRKDPLNREGNPSDQPTKKERKRRIIT